MKKLTPISNLRNTISLNIRETGSRLYYLKNQNIDLDVFLNSKNKNLQRDLVWNLNQKREIIMSIILGKHIPHVSIINTVARKDGKQLDYEVLQVIDGKQRLSSIFDFLDDKFTIFLEDNEWLFSELPEDYQRGIEHFHIRYYEVLEEWNTPITDDEKIQWFKFINFAGTPQDKEHMNSL